MEVLNGVIALYQNPEIGVSVLPIFSGKPPEGVSLNEDGEVELDEKGTLKIPSSAVGQVTGFQLVFRIPTGNPPVLLQRSLNRIDKADKRYQSNALLDREGGDEWTMLIMLDHVVVSREDGVSWTRWRGDVPNRVDIWSVAGNQIRLFQIGVIVRDTETGEVFRVLGENRGAWNLYQNGAGIVGVATYPEAGEFSVRKTILENNRIKDVLAKTELPSLTGPVPEIPALEPSPNGAVMQWWSPFAGMRGQGPCTLANRSSAWICGEDYLGEPDADGIVRLPRGTTVSYADIVALRGKAYGDSEDAPRKFRKLTKLIGVNRV